MDGFPFFNENILQFTCILLHISVRESVKSSTNVQDFSTGPSQIHALNEDEGEKKSEYWELAPYRAKTAPGAVKNTYF
jgi:hypothetical protein